MPYSQANRLIAIQTPLGDNSVLLKRFSGRETISNLFHFSVDLLSEDENIQYKDIIGKQVTVSVRLPHGKRYWNGFVSRFASLGRDDRFTYYRAEIVPWLWFLTRTADCQIFQQKTIPEIIRKFFKIMAFRTSTIVPRPAI